MASANFNEQQVEENVAELVFPKGMMRFNVNLLFIGNIRATNAGLFILAIFLYYRYSF